MIKVKIYTDKHIIETEIGNVSKGQLLDMVKRQLIVGNHILLGDVIVDKEYFIGVEVSS